jgi:hypothetical protein
VHTGRRGWEHPTYPWIILETSPLPSLQALSYIPVATTGVNSVQSRCDNAMQGSSFLLGSIEISTTCTYTGRFAWCLPAPTFANFMTINATNTTLVASLLFSQTYHRLTTA